MTEASAGLEGSFLFGKGAKYDGGYTIKEPDGVIVRQGKGKLIDGPESYDGDWIDDLMEGRGVYVFGSGAIYRGEFVKNKFEGQGEYQWPDGATYIGEWRDNRMHGDGVYRDAQGVQWKGSFYNGKYNNNGNFVSLRSSS